MDIDPMESATEASSESASGSARLSTLVAITVALLATFLGICKVKDDNIVQAMQQAQADRLDHWNFYQARNIREEIAAATVAQLKLASAGASAAQQATYREAIASYERLVADQASKKEDLLALTALTHKPWLYGVALIPTAGGFIMGLAGLLGWHLHPEMFARLLS